MGINALPRLAALLVSVFLLQSCVPPAKAPMRTVYFTPTKPSANRVLMVFLPGKGDQPESYETEGFVNMVKDLKLPVDMMGADAHLGYYLRRNFPKRLHEDVISTARARGYEQIWLVGISLCGLGALWYDGIYPGEVDGLVSLAPYLGEPETAAEVSKAGGLAAWNPGHVEPDDMQRQIWRGLKAYLSPGKTISRVYLGYGLQDRFAGPDGVFATVLPGNQVFTCQGNHDWDTWRQLWADALNDLRGRWQTALSDAEK